MNNTQEIHSCNTLEEYLQTQNKEHLKSAFLEAFRHIGVIAPACQKAGISRSTYYRWYLEDSDFSYAVLEAFNALYEEKGTLLEQIPHHKRHELFQLREDCEE